MDTIARQLMITLKGCGNQERCLRAGRKQMSLVSSKKSKKEGPGNHQPVNLISIPAKVMRHLVLEAITVHMDNKNVIRAVSMNSLKVNHA